MDPNTQLQTAAQPVPSVEEQHRQSTAAYPKLNLSENEFVIQTIDRHSIGKLGMWVVLGLLSLAVLAGLIFYGADYTSLSSGMSHLPSVGIIAIPAILLLVLFGVIGWISNTVYNGNRIYLTNESIIQHVQTSLFSTKNEQLNLVKIEDVTVIQNGIMQKMFNYGTVEVNTMDSNDAHTLTLVRNPQTAANAIHNAAEQAISRNPESRAPSTGPAIS